RGRERVVSHCSRFVELAKLEQHLAQLGKQGQALRIIFLQQGDGATEQVAGGVGVATRERSSPRGCQAARTVGADLPPLLVERPQLGQVVVRLLEVIAEDRLELKAGAAPGVSSS